MIGLIICSLLLIKTEVDIYETGFYYNDNGGQHMIIDVAGSLKNLKSVYLMTKTCNEDEIDYLYVASYKQCTRIMRVEKKFEGFDENEGSVLKSSKEYEDLRNRDFYTIYVDMKDVDKTPFITYVFDFVFDDNDRFMTKPFYYSEEHLKWKLGHSEVDVTN